VRIAGIPELDSKRRLSSLLSSGSEEAREIVRALAPDAISRIDSYDRSCGRGAVLSSEQWKRAVSYAFANAKSRWLEDGNSGDPTVSHLEEWVPYYLSQQWSNEFPIGSIWIDTPAGKP